MAKETKIGKVVSDYVARIDKAEKLRKRQHICDPPIGPVEFLDETEEKIVDNYMVQSKRDTERRRAQKAAMSKDELQNFLDKNAKLHRDRRATKTEQRMTKWINYYLMLAKNTKSDKSRLEYLERAEKEKLKYQNLRAPDSSALLSQGLNANEIINSKKIEITSINGNQAEM